MTDLDSDLAHLLLQLLGPTTIASTAAVWIRQWVKSKLRAFESLVAQAPRDQQWQRLATARVRILEDQLETARRNNHAMRNYVTGLSIVVEQVADACKVKVRLPDPPRWEMPRAITGDDLLKVLEADAGKPNAEESQA